MTIQSSLTPFLSGTNITISHALSPLLLSVISALSAVKLNKVYHHERYDSKQNAAWPNLKIYQH